MKRLALILGISALTCLACGDGSLTLVGDGNGNSQQDTAKVQGNVRDLNPQVAGANVVVFVFTDLANAVNEDGTLEFNTDGTLTFEKQRSVNIDSEADPMEFTVVQVESGNVTVVFLQDDANDPDGQINPGDPYAVLEEPNDVLKNVRNGETIQITDVDLDFDARSADAVSVRSVTSDTVPTQ